LRGVVGDDGEHDVGGGGDVGESRADPRIEFGAERLRGGRVSVIHGGDGVALFFEATRHVGAHAADADE